MPNKRPPNTDNPLSKFERKHSILCTAHKLINFSFSGFFLFFIYTPKISYSNNYTIQKLKNALTNGLHKTKMLSTLIFTYSQKYHILNKIDNIKTQFSILFYKITTKNYSLWASRISSFVFLNFWIVVALSHSVEFKLVQIW